MRHVSVVQFTQNLSGFLFYQLALAGILIMLGVPANAAERDVKSKIVSVQVFPSGAEITRVAKIKLEAGDHTIVLGDLPAQALPGSIRVEGKATGELKIGSVDSRRLFIPRADALKIAGERQTLEDKIQGLKDQLGVLKGRIEGAQAQRTLITNLSNLPNRPAPHPLAAGAGQPEDWPHLLTFIGTSMSEISRSILDSKIEIRKVKREVAELEKKLSELVPRRKERTQVKVFVSAKTPLDADLLVRYQVRRASWTPYYDARLSTGTKTVTQKLELTRRASITQHTGENWKNVSITLSTTRPKAGSAPPVLQPMTVDFKPKYRPPPAPAPMAESAPMPRMEMADKEYDGRRRAIGLAAKPKKARMRVVAQSANVATTPFQAVFEVPGKVSVSSTGEAKRVQISIDVFEPKLSVRTVPRLDPKAYLIASLKIPKGAPLMAGSVSLFRDGTFVGTGNLPLLAGNEEHHLGFGVDDLVRVRHNVVRDNKGETGLISSSRTETRVYKVSLKNLHERAIAFTIQDQIPVSKNDDITVERIGSTRPTKTNVDNKRGVVAWEGTLNPDQERELTFGYKVTWPAAREIRYGR